MCRSRQIHDSVTADGKVRHISLEPPSRSLGTVVRALTQGLLALSVLSAPIPAQSPEQSPDTVALVHANVVSMAHGEVLPDRSVIIVGDEVVAIGRSGAEPLPPGAEIHDLGGGYVLPGLIDAHVHLREPERSLALFPVNGVTTVVNLEGEASHLDLRQRVLSDGVLAPRILSSGPFLDEEVSSPEEVRQEVRRQSRAGFDLIKIHGDMADGAFLAAVGEADQVGLPVVGHRPDNVPTSVVLGSGMDALAHMEEVLGSSLIREPAELSPDSMRAIGRVVAGSGTAVITTLGFFTGMRDQATEAFYEMIRWPELALVSPERRRAWLYDGHREYIEPKELPWYDAAVELLHGVTMAIQQEGGTVIAGTDTPLEFTIPGHSLLREMDHLVEAGLTPAEALRAATRAPADLVGRSDLGRVEVGAAADLIVVDSDPTESLDVLHRPRAIVLRGRWIPHNDLDDAVTRLAAAYAQDEVTRAARERVRQEVLSIARDEGIERAEGELLRLRRSPGAPDLGEGDLNSLGYALLEGGDTDAAILIFRLNARLYPESANVHDSLGEAYLRAGRLDEAEREYRWALRLDPGMDSSRRGLEEIAERRRAFRR